MSDKKELHPKQSFQVDRIAFFSDAVFAIVITLMVIEFKVPHITPLTTKEDAVQQLLDLKFNFVAILFSFFAVAQQWFQHHLFFKYIHNYNNQVLKASVFILLPIIFFPFSTTFFAESFISDMTVALGLRIFAINILAATLGTLYFYYVTFMKSKDCTYPIPKEEKIKFLSGSVFSLIFCVILIIGTLISDSYVFILWAVALASLTRIPIQKIVNKRFKV